MKDRYFLPRLAITLFAAMLAASPIASHAQTYTTIYNFASHSCDPINPRVSGAITQGRDGNLYSSTASGGCFSNGAVFKITPKGKLTVVHSFQLNQKGDGIGAQSGVTMATDGNFWGTNEGEDFNQGNIFKTSPGGKVTNFDNALGGTNDTNGSQPVAPPVQGRDGNLYGMTTSGGNTAKCTYGNGGCGVIYRITPAGKYEVIYTFDQTHGANPDGPLVLGTDGNFYGTTFVGGTVNDGVVFKVTPSGKYTVLHNFCSQSNCGEGGQPVDGLAQGSDGNFYGTTTIGGAHGGAFVGGTAFKITPAGKYTVLHSFCALTKCTDGTTPNGGLTQASDGNFYGTTVAGGTNNYGIIYQITAAGKFSALYSFVFTTGAIPETTLTQNTNGILYGDTIGGGDGTLVNCGGNRCGVFYSFDMGLKPFVSMVAAYGQVGQTIEFLGQGFTGTTAVSFNGKSGAFTVVSDTYLTAIVPSGTTAGVVTVTTPAGELTSNRAFRVLPAILSFNPTSGSVGTPVTIKGTSFTGATRVTFGGVKAPFTVKSDIEIDTSVPSGAKTGAIEVTTPDGTAVSSTKFTVTQ